MNARAIDFAYIRGARVFVPAVERDLAELGEAHARDAASKPVHVDQGLAKIALLGGRIRAGLPNGLANAAETNAQPSSRYAPGVVREGFVVAVSIDAQLEGAWLVVVAVGRDGAHRDVTATHAAHSPDTTHAARSSGAAAAAAPSGSCSSGLVTPATPRRKHERQTEAGQLEPSTHDASYSGFLAAVYSYRRDDLVRSRSIQ